MFPVGALNLQGMERINTISSQTPKAFDVNKESSQADHGSLEREILVKLCTGGEFEFDRGPKWGSSRGEV